MKRYVVIIVTAALLAGANPPAEQSQTEDLKALQGGWRLVLGIQDGQEWPAEERRKVRIEFGDDGFQIWRGGMLATGRTGTISLDATTNPRSMDATTVEGGVSVTSLGIYAISGDKYKVCFAPPGQPRPTDFTCAPGSGRRLQVWKKQSAPVALQQPELFSVPGPTSELLQTAD